MIFPAFGFGMVLINFSCVSRCKAKALQKQQTSDDKWHARNASGMELNPGPRGERPARQLSDYGKKEVTYRIFSRGIQVIFLLPRFVFTYCYALLTVSKTENITKQQNVFLL